MNNTILSVGDILFDNAHNTRYRVIAIIDNLVTLCEMDTTKFVLSQLELSLLIGLLTSKELNKEIENVPIFDVDSLSDSVKEKYQVKKNIINELLSTTEKTFMSLSGKTPKPQIKEIMGKYNIPKNSLWRIITNYFQSGMQDYSLIDAKAFGVNKGKEYEYKSRPGMPAQYPISSKIILSPETKNNFEEALNFYKSGRCKSIKNSFDYMNNLHYTHIEIINGVKSLTLLPVNERPSFGQFYYYFRKHLSQQEKDLIKTSAIEQRNNKRLITSDSLSDVYGPCDMVEIDACEADVSLVSSLDTNKTIGRPIVYFMIDVYTRVIVAMSVAFDNNSVLGVTNLFLNLADDKQEYCNRYGMGFENPALWPSNVIPRRLRVDRGSEFKSKAFDRICNELGIEKQIVSGASGSLKGLVEQSFHQMHSRQNVHLEDKGLIEKRYDSEHHKEASLTIEQYTKMVISFVLMHNQQALDNYHMTKEMLEKDVKPIPILLWQYGVKKYGEPRPITNKEQYLFNLMTPINAKLSRRGICYKDLWYICYDDKALSREMFNAGTKKVPIEVRMDMRDISNVYYIRDNKLVTAQLNPKITGNADYLGMTMKEYENYRTKRKELAAQGRIHNEELSAYNYAVNASIVDDAKKTTYSDKSDMRPNRELAKQDVSSKNKISKRLKNEQVESITIDVPQEENINNSVKSTTDSTNTPPQEKDYTNWADAMDLFD